LVLADSDATTWEIGSAGGNLKFFEGTDTFMTIDTSGNVGIGTSSPSQKLEVDGRIKLGGMILQNTSDGGSIGFNRNPADGAYIGNASLRRFQVNGPNTVGGDFWEFQSYNSSGTHQGNIRIQDGKLGIGTTPSEMLHIVGGGNGPEIRMQNSSSSHYIRAYNDNWNFLANSTNTAMTIRNSGQVDFGAGLGIGGTGAANTLDDYEEGTWTPAGYSDITINSIENATYTKVGRLVTVNAWIKVNITSTNFQISGLPFSTGSDRTTGTLSDASNADVISNQIVGTIIYSYGASTSGTNNDFFISASYKT